MKPQILNPPEIAYAAEEAFGGGYHLRPIIAPARNDGRSTKASEVKRMWVAFFKRKVAEVRHA